MNELNFTEFAHQENQSNFLVRKETNSKNFQEVERPCSSWRIDQFPSLPPVLVGYNCKRSSFSDKNTHSRSAANDGKNENIKELWSAEELTVNLVNKTAMRIASLKHKLDEQLKNIQMLQENKEKQRDCPEPIHEQNFDHSHTSIDKDFGLSNTNEKTRTVEVPEKQKYVNHTTKNKSKLTKICVQRPSVSQKKRKKRLRRGIPFKEFFYHPLVVDCSASVPGELTKREFLRQLRLIPTCVTQPKTASV